jgi:hypothetical protein
VGNSFQDVLALSSPFPLAYALRANSHITDAQYQKEVRGGSRVDHTWKAGIKSGIHYRMIQQHERIGAYDLLIAQRIIIHSAFLRSIAYKFIHGADGARVSIFIALYQPARPPNKRTFARSQYDPGDDSRPKTWAPPNTVQSQMKE